MSRFGGFLLRRAAYVRHPSTDKPALSALFNIDGTDHIGVAGVVARDASGAADPHSA